MPDMKTLTQELVIQMSGFDKVVEMKPFIMKKIAIKDDGAVHIQLNLNKFE